MLRLRFATGLTALTVACGGIAGERRAAPPSDHADAASNRPGDDAGLGGAVGGPEAGASAGGSTSSHIGPGASGGVTATGSGGASAAGSSAASGGATSGAGASSLSGGASGKNPEADAGSPLTDPRAQARQALAQNYCAQCGGSDPSCAESNNVYWYRTVPDGCWDELAASVACSLKNGCSPVSGGLVGQGACLDERNALGGCIVGQRLSGEVTGTSGTCTWDRDSSSTRCLVECTDDPYHWYGSDCSGPPGGPFDCWCTLNGRQLGDSLVTNGPEFFSDTCTGAAELMANAHCQKYVACCYTYRAPPFEGLPEQDECDCTSDPTAAGFSSCADLAASMKDGKVVDLCPKYQL